MAKQQDDSSSFSGFLYFIGIIILLNALGEILGVLISGAFLVGGIIVVWNVGSAILKGFYNYYQTPATIKDIDQELNKIVNHKKVLTTKISVLKAENDTFTNRKKTEATTASTIRLVEEQIEQRKQRISLFNNILSLHDKRVQKLSVFKQEYLLLRDIDLSNKQHESSGSQATQEYANLVNNIDLNIKYDYTEKMDSLVSNLDSGFSQQDTNAAITHLTEIIQQEIDTEQLFNEANSREVLNTPIEKLILEDLYQLRLKAKKVA